MSKISLATSQVKGFEEIQKMFSLRIDRARLALESERKALVNAQQIEEQLLADYTKSKETLLGFDLTIRQRFSELEWALDATLNQQFRGVLKERIAQSQTAWVKSQKNTLEQKHTVDKAQMALNQIEQRATSIKDLARKGKSLLANVAAEMQTEEFYETRRA